MQEVPVKGKKGKRKGRVPSQMLTPTDEMVELINDETLQLPSAPTHVSPLTFAPRSALSEYGAPGSEVAYTPWPTLSYAASADLTSLAQERYFSLPIPENFPPYLPRPGSSFDNFMTTGLPSTSAFSQQMTAQPSHPSTALTSNEFMQYINTELQATKNRLDNLRSSPPTIVPAYPLKPSEEGNDYIQYIQQPAVSTTRPDIAPDEFQNLNRGEFKKPKGRAKRSRNSPTYSDQNVEITTDYSLPIFPIPPVSPMLYAHLPPMPPSYCMPSTYMEEQVSDEMALPWDLSQRPRLDEDDAPLDLDTQCYEKL